LLYGMDPERRHPHRISLGVEQYTSVAASADGHRLVATVTNPEASLWRMPISDRIAEESDAGRIVLPTVRGLSPRIGPGYLLYLSSKGGNDGIWKFGDATAVELWRLAWASPGWCGHFTRWRAHSFHRSNGWTK